MPVRKLGWSHHDGVFCAAVAACTAVEFPPFSSERNCGKPQMKTHTERMSQGNQARVVSWRLKFRTGSWRAAAGGSNASTGGYIHSSRGCQYRSSAASAAIDATP